MATRFLSEFGFTSKLDFEVWKHHASGLSPEKISPLIKKKGLKANKDTIYKIIARLEKLMRSGLFFGE